MCNDIILSLQQASSGQYVEEVPAPGLLARKLETILRGAAGQCCHSPYNRHLLLCGPAEDLLYIRFKLGSSFQKDNGCANMYIVSV